MDDLPDREGTPRNRLWLFGDGSGGVNTSDPRLRRAAWAWVEVQASSNVPSTQLHRVKCAPMHGRRQTVNRCELMALLDGVRSTRGSISFVSDSGYVVKGFRRMAKNPAKYNPKSNRDLWSALRTEAKTRDIEVFKIESHLEDDDPSVINGTVPLAWVRGNQAADDLAGEAAVDAQLPAARIEAVK